MFGSAFVTNYPNTGTGGAICGMAAMQLAELGIASHFIKSKGKMAMKHVLVLTVVYLTGLLPGVRSRNSIPIRAISLLSTAYFIHFPDR